MDQWSIDPMVQSMFYHIRFESEYANMSLREEISWCMEFIYDRQDETG